MNHRKSYSNSEASRGALSPEKREMLINKASAYMVVKFHDGNTWSKWSNELGQRKITNISEAVNEMFRIIEKSFRGSATVLSAAIFDVREHKKPGSFNKIYQYEKGVWKMVQHFTW